jgi:hypothetical protein
MVTIRKLNVEAEREEGIKVGKMNELIINAGRAEAIPAMSHASASRLRVGKPNHFEEVAHQAKTGIENPMTQRGRANMRYRRIPIVSVYSFKRGNVARMPTMMVSVNTTHTCLCGGRSRIESSGVRKRLNEVGSEVYREPPSGRG